MARSTGGPTHARKRKRLLKSVAGMRGMSGHNYRPAIEFSRKAGVYAYRDRRQKKRHFRALWITRFNAALKQRGLSYNRFIPAMVAAGIELNRKMMSELAIGDPSVFDAIVALVKPHITGPARKVAAGS
jgi:large subunit ribosomal protein L20